MKLFAITATLAASKSTRNETNRPQPQVRKFLGQGSSRKRGNQGECLFQSAAKPKFLEESSHSHSLNEGLDIFYPKSLLKKLAGQGIDVTNFRPAVTPGGLAAQKARAAVSYHSKAGFQKKCFFLHRIRRALSIANQRKCNNLKTIQSGTQKDHIQYLVRKL